MNTGNERQSNDRLSRAALAVAILSAAISLSALGVGARQFHTDERAWISLQPPNFSPKTDDTSKYAGFQEVEFRFKNTGKTVAWIERGWVISVRLPPANETTVHAILNKFMTEGYRLPNNTEANYVMSGPPQFDGDEPGLLRVNRMPATLAPGEETLVPNQVPVTDPDPKLEEVFKQKPHTGTLFIPSPSTFSHVLGRVDYKDSFGTSHWITFCYLYISRNTFSNCSAGNETDDD